MQSFTLSYRHISTSDPERLAGVASLQHIALSVTEPCASDSPSESGELTIYLSIATDNIILPNNQSILNAFIKFHVSLVLIAVTTSEF